MLDIGASPIKSPHLSTLTPLRQSMLALYWFSLSFHAGALLGVAIPAQLSALANSARATVLLAALDTAGLLIMAWTRSVGVLFAGYLLASLGNAVSGAAYQAYIPDHVPPRQYGEASGYLGAMSMLGTIVSFGAAAFLVSPQHVATFYVVTGVLISGGACFTAVAVTDPPGQALGAVFGLALGTYMAVDWALAVDVLPDEGFAAKDLGLWGLSTNLPQTAAPFVGGAVLTMLRPAGPAVAYGVLFAAAAACAALSGVLAWRIQVAR